MNGFATQLKVLAFEGFDGGSHLQVRRSLSRHSRHDWTWVTRPGRSWKWRLATGALELVSQAAEEGKLEARPDVIFATSMVSVGDLRALLPRDFRDCPIVLYMHENQAAYPFRWSTRHEEERDHQFALKNLNSIAVADSVIWNSRWNKDSFCRAIESLLRRSPDGSLGNVSGWIDDKSCVRWPPVDRPDEVLHNTADGDNSGPFLNGHGNNRIVWPHRWEHDKGPDTLLRLARFLESKSPGQYTWVLLGEQFRRIPEPLQEFLHEFRGAIDHAGWVQSKHEYWSILRDCGWVLSTARHEFFGIAVVESMLAGCLPWLPRRLSYPEIVPEALWGISPAKPPEDSDEARRMLSAHLSATKPSRALGEIDGLLTEVASRNPI